jgi:hypothetical protein
MKICPSCSTQNREGIFFCDDCGQSLVGVTSIATKAFQASQMGGSGSLRGAATWGTSSFNSSNTLLFHVREYPDPFSVQPGIAMQLVIGRLDPNTGAKPDIDLGPYGGQEKGVSRTHAALRRMEQTMTLVDLGSVNGTFLNGQRLVANQPRILRDGDEIRVGKLAMHVYFK